MVRTILKSQKIRKSLLDNKDDCLTEFFQVKVRFLFIKLSIDLLSDLRYEFNLVLCCVNTCDIIPAFYAGSTSGGLTVGATLSIRGRTLDAVIMYYITSFLHNAVLVVLSITRQ